MLVGKQAVGFAYDLFPFRIHGGGLSLLDYSFVEKDSFTIAGECEIEVYLPSEDGSAEMSAYIWVPVKKTKEN